MSPPEWSIQHVARLTGTTSRALRHYDAIGLLHPAGTGANGYRHYGPDELVRLQRILLLRDLGLSLAQIAAVLEDKTPAVAALATHREWLLQEQRRLGRQLASVEGTIARLERGEPLMAEEMFDGFERHRDEVIERWGASAYAAGDTWWRGMSDTDRDRWRRDSEQLIADWQDAAGRGIRPDSAPAQDLARRQVDWLRGVPGTPAADPDADLAAYVTALADMYVADERFAATYGGTANARFIRDSLHHYMAQRG